MARIEAAKSDTIKWVIGIAFAQAATILAMLRFVPRPARLGERGRRETGRIAEPRYFSVRSHIANILSQVSSAASVL